LEENFLTPFDIQTEVRLADFGDYKTKVKELRSEDSKKCIQYIKSNKKLYAAKRPFDHLSEMVLLFLLLLLFLAQILHQIHKFTLLNQVGSILWMETNVKSIMYLFIRKIISKINFLRFLDNPSNHSIFGYHLNLRFYFGFAGSVLSGYLLCRQRNQFVACIQWHAF